LYTVQLDTRIHRYHLVFIDQALHAQHSSENFWLFLREFGPIQKYRLIRREVAKIVFECAQIVIGDFGIGRVKISQVDVTSRQASVRQIVLDAENILLRQAVVQTQAGPTITALHNLCAETEHKFRMRTQV